MGMRYQIMIAHVLYMTEQELLNKIKEIEQEYSLAKKRLADAKKKWLDEETNLINNKITLDKLKESLRILRNSTPSLELESREREIERFRKAHPELCQFALERDLKKCNGK